MAKNERTWFMVLNLDAFNALVMSMGTDADRSSCLQGLTLGCNQGPCPQDAPDPFRRAWELGTTWRQKAEASRADPVKAGKASAAARKEKFGSAQPRRRPPEHPFGQDDNYERTFGGCSGKSPNGSRTTHNPEEKIKRCLDQGKLNVGPEHVPAPPEPAPSLDFQATDPSEVLPPGDLDDFDAPGWVAPVVQAERSLLPGRRGW